MRSKSQTTRETLSAMEDERVGEERDWSVFDSWQGRWCPRPWTSYDEALRTAEDYNKREAIGSRRYQAQRRPESG